MKVKQREKEYQKNVCCRFISVAFNEKNTRKKRMVLSICVRQYVDDN